MPNFYAFHQTHTSLFPKSLVFQSVSSYDKLSLNQNMEQVGHLSTKLMYIYIRALVQSAKIGLSPTYGLGNSGTRPTWIG